MKRKTLLFLVAALSVLITFTVIAAADGNHKVSSASHPVTYQADVRSASSAQVTWTEYWRLGITSEVGAAHADTHGRLVQAAAAFRSYRGTTDQHFIFPAPGGLRTLQSASYCILGRGGTYPGTATLTLEIIDFAGNVQRVASAAEIDLGTAATGIWSSLALSNDPADLEIAAGELLAFHFALDGAPAGDLAVYPAFEVQVARGGEASAPAMPALLEPPHGTVTFTHDITLVWTESFGAMGYHVLLDGGDVVTTSNTTLQTQMSTGIHTWTVRAFNSAGASPWAAPWALEVATHELFLPLVVRAFGP
jgi:hypothetical protein